MIKLGGLVTLKPINEAEYVHIGYGKYKEKGKEKDPKAVTYQKDDNGKFTPISSHAAAAKGGDSSAGEDKPKVNIFDKPKKDKKDKSSSSEPDYDKYTSKAQTVTDFIKGDLSTDDIKKIADKNFGKEVATQKELDDFLNNKFIQGMMADTYGVDKEQMVSKVKELKAALFGGEKSEPKSDYTPKVKARPADKVLVKTVDKFSKKLGLTPEKLGKEEYEKHMLSYIHDALEDANFHSANRQIFADLQGRPELAKRPEYGDAPKFGTPEREEWDEKNSIYNKAFDASVTEFDDSDEAVGALTSQASWEGEKIIDALLSKLRKDGSGELADKIQISFDKDMAKNESTSNLSRLLPDGIIQEGTRSQVGLIDRNGKIISAYVHYDGYPSNMKPGLKKHMKSEKDVLTLIKRGGASGIYDDEDIKYYDDKKAKPVHGNFKDIKGYLDKTKDSWADYVYLYNVKDKKWYFANPYKDNELQKLF